MGSPHTAQFDLFKAIPFNLMTDPGTGVGPIYVDRHLANLPLTVTSAGGTRTIALPDRPGVILTLFLGLLVSGNTVKVLIGDGTQTFDGTNKYVTLSAYSQSAVFRSVPIDGSTYKWVLMHNQGAALAAA